MAEPTPPSNVLTTPIRRELEDILSVRGADRENRLLASNALPAVVSMMPPEELFFTLKELSPEHVPTVLAHARTEQVVFALDLDLWRKDRLRPDRIVPWLGTLAACGSSNLARWVRDMDLADLTLILGQIAQVMLPEDDNDDPFQNLPGPAPFTLDGFYHVQCSEKHDKLVRSVLIVVREAQPERYHQLMEALIRDVDSELEEHVYQARQRRLAERGFPEWEEALKVYTRIEVDSADDLPLRPGAPLDLSEPGDPSVPPRYPVAAVGGRAKLLARALGEVTDPSILETLWTELAFATNRILVADGLAPDRVTSFERALRKVAGYVSIGLQILTGDDPSRAARLLERHHLQHLFGLGWTRVRRLGHGARRVLEEGWPAGRKERLLFLDSPLPEIVEGLLMPHPLHHDHEAGDDAYRNFETLGEIERATTDLARAEFLGRYLMGVVELNLDELNEAVMGVDTDNLKGSTVFLTALAQAALGEPFRFAPLDRALAPEALARLWVDDVFPRRVKPELLDAALAWSKTAGRVTKAEEPLLRTFVTDCFRLLEEEFGHLPRGERPDPRFTRGLWIR